MRWSDVREAHPEQWLVIEALEGHSEDETRIVDRVAVIENCADGRDAMRRYRELRIEHPHRELCFVHTSNVEIRMEERGRFGLRGIRAAEPET